MVGKVPHEVTISQIEDILRPVPLPVKDAVPKETCVTWVKAAIRALQEAELVEKFDVDGFMAHAQDFANKRMAKGGPPEYINYTSRVM